MEGLSGKRALVTGGAAGIGRAIALELARSGCDVALIDVDAGKAEATAGEVRALGRKAAAAVGDVADTGSVRAALAKLGSEPFDILVNNAGICRLAPLLTMSERDMAAGLMDAPWPPVYPKQPNEPPRVAPSRARAPDA